MEGDLVESCGEFFGELAIAFFAAVIVLCDVCVFVITDHAERVLCSVGFELECAGVGEVDPFDEATLLKVSRFFEGCLRGKGECAGLEKGLCVGISQKTALSEVVCFHKVFVRVVGL